ncbi:hypothetical protein Tco_0921242 [Tanacetum coccineum]
MRELTLFLGLQVEQKKDGIFICEDKYVAKILKKFGFTEVKTASTPMETQKPLLKDEDSEEVDVHMYRSMICSLMYLTSSRPDITFAVCACARYQVNLKVSHLYAVKRIFRYLKGQPKLGLWYPKDSPFDLVAYTDSDYAGASLDRKSTTGGCQFLGCRLISWQCKKQTVVANSTTEAEYVAASSCCGQVLWIQNQLLDYGAKTTAWNEFSSTMTSAIICLATNQKFNFSKYIFESMVRNLDNLSRKFLMYLRLPYVLSLEAEQDSGNITKTRSKATPNESSSLRTTSGGGPRYQETMGDTIAQTRFENVSKLSNDSLLKVLDLEKIKTTQANEIASLKRRVKKLEQKKRSRTHGLKRLYKVGLTARVESSRDEDLDDDASKQGRRINAIDADEDITLLMMMQTKKCFDVDALDVKPKAKGIAFREPGESTTTIFSQQLQDKGLSQDKGKGILVEPEKPLKKKDQLKLDEEIALKLQAEINEEERIARSEEEKIDEANIAWDDIQAKVDADYQLAERLQAEEQE